MSNDKMKIAKAAIRIISGAGCSKVVNDIIRNNTNVETTMDSIKVLVGSIVIGTMVADAGSDHVEAKFDQLVGIWKDIKSEEVTETKPLEYKSDR